ncbi:MAG: TonB-dependent receptor [Bacteroidales bacterium]|nr:TonB-dependent receptor [Bacteroidales bacterium]MBN2761906.1 TonB-dependent receptor [Bacteroidales bacterium]
MKGSISFFILCFLVIYPVCAQKKAVIRGNITDATDNLPLVGATVLFDSTKGTVSDTAGIFMIEVLPGRYTLDIKYIGYKSKRVVVNTVNADAQHVHVELYPETQMLDEIVVSANKYEQKISDVIVSMDIIKADRIAAGNTTSLEYIINQSPGIDILDGQPRIRGGSSYSYGAGSRVLVLVDGLPILSPDAGDVKWEYLPVENISQIEIIKGASSVLYGSSALNGIINIRTAYPKNKPFTKVILFGGLYMNPKREALVWWDNQPVLFGASAFHSRKAGNLDLVFGYHGFNDGGYRENEWDKRNRVNMNLLYRDKKIKGLSYGMNFNQMIHDKIDFFLWQNADSGAYRQNTSAVARLKGFRLNVDPYIEYYNDKGGKHSLKTRYFRIKNNYPDIPDKDNAASYFYAEYQYHKRFLKPVELTFGMAAAYADITSILYENHTSLNGSLYSQLDWQMLKRLKLSLGVRFEAYQLDDTWEYTRPVTKTGMPDWLADGEYPIPVFRAGMNYQPAEFTFLRASFGQGYRFPSVAEKYTATSLSAMHIFPNPDLTSEHGWSAELGLKQGFHIKSWTGMLDFSLFQTRYTDMIEFTFGIYKPDSVPIPTFDHIGFKALNIGNARITGFETILGITGNIFSIPVTLQAGYTYIYPVDLDFDTAKNNSSSGTNILKYRFRHSVKADVELSWKKLSTGFCLIYNSFMENVDKVFIDPVMGNLILPGYPEYREQHRKGYMIVDHRLSYQVVGFLQVALITKNLFNREYIGRPGDIGPPRNITLQLSVSF